MTKLVPTHDFLCSHRATATPLIFAHTLRHDAQLVEGAIMFIVYMMATVIGHEASVFVSFGYAVSTTIKYHIIRTQDKN
jgi:hypothetical protein